MRLAPALLASVISFAVAVPALALPEPTCRYEGKTLGRPLPFGDGPIDEPSRLGLSAAVLLALSGDQPDWPDAEVENAAPCPFTEFRAGDAGWTVSGGAGRAPARFIHSPTREDYLFLALGPTLAEAHSWFLSGATGPLTPKAPVYYLVRATAGPRLVYRAYDGIPPADDLANDATAVIEGRLEPIAALDPQGQAVTVLVPTGSGVRAQLFGPEDHPASLYGPDGKYFQEVADGVAQMRGSGFRCPPTLGSLALARTSVLNRSEAGLDLSCSFQGEETWITLFVTRVHEPLDAKFDVTLEDARSEGVRSTVDVRVPGMVRGAAWLDRKSAGQGLWMTRRGPYLVEVRATFAPQDQSAVERAVGTLARQAAEIPDR